MVNHYYRAIGSISSSGFFFVISYNMAHVESWITFDANGQKGYIKIGLSHDKKIFIAVVI